MVSHLNQPVPTRAQWHFGCVKAHADDGNDREDSSSMQRRRALWRGTSFTVIIIIVCYCLELWNSAHPPLEEDI
jgi:hypothetical protein